MARRIPPPSLALDLPTVAPPARPALGTALNGWMFGSLEPGAYGLIYIDPPWKQDFYSEDTGIEKAPQAHYDCMELEDIKSMPVGQLAARNCFIVMWSMWNFVAPGYATDVLRAWGFEPKSGGAWFKLTKHGKPAFGTGYGFRGCCEPFLTGSIGRPAIVSASERNGVVTDVDSAPDLHLNAMLAQLREHSRKPDELRDALGRMFPHVRKAELFGRQRFDGWESWGNQVGMFDAEGGGAQ